MSGPKSIKDLAELIWTKEHSRCDYKFPAGFYVDSKEYTLQRDYLNEITRIESILIEFKRELVDTYQARIEELEDQLATSDAKFKDLVHEITKARKFSPESIRPHLSAVATTGCQSSGETVEPEDRIPPAPYLHRPAYNEYRP